MKRKAEDSDRMNPKSRTEKTTKLLVNEFGIAPDSFRLEYGILSHCFSS